MRSRHGGIALPLAGGYLNIPLLGQGVKSRFFAN